MIKNLLLLFLIGLTFQVQAQKHSRDLGQKSYEISNHLGNVMTVVSDRKLDVVENSSLVITSSETDVLSYRDYYPYGMLMDGRNDSKGYRYGFQGQEKDDEVKGKENSVNYKYRVHDARLGRFFSVDPLSAKYPFYSPYHFSGNRLIDAIELEGLEEYIISPIYYETSRGQTRLRAYKYRYVEKNVRTRLFDKIGSFAILDNTSNDEISLLSPSIRKILKMQMVKLKNKNRITFDRNDLLYKQVKEHHLKAKGGRARNQVPFGTKIIGWKQKMRFAPDQGNTLEQVQTQFNNSPNIFRDNLDFQVAILVNEPNAIMIVRGTATSTPTDINGTQKAVTAVNNQTLATQRARAGRQFIINYAQINYGVDVTKQVTITTRVIPQSTNAITNARHRAISFITR